MQFQKTYWHLLKHKRIPSEYEIVSSELLYYPRLKFEVSNSVTHWYEQYQTQSPLYCSDWEHFQDPRKTTYTKYTQLQSHHEAHIDEILESIERQNYDQSLSRSWLDALDSFFSPWIYLFHGLQMAAAYVGQMAPSGKISIVAAFQAADEMRRLQRVAYRIRQLQLLDPQFGEKRQSQWQNEPIWQLTRKGLEYLLVTYDWGEALVALNLVVKPIWDEFWMNDFAEVAARHQDYLMKELLLALNQDCQWHRQWTQSLFQTIFELNPETQEIVGEWIRKWHPVAMEAVETVLPLFEKKKGIPAPKGMRPNKSDLQKRYRAFLHPLKLVTFLEK
jgi:toluene monooxygenase system protein E